MTLSTTGSPSDGLVYITMTGRDASGRGIVEQGSGILLSDDEVLTAAHLVYNPDGSVRTSGTAAVGYNAGASIASSKIDGVQVGPGQDFTSIAGMGSDYAVVHLSSKVTAGTVFSLGSDVTSGSFQVSGYPLGTAGKVDTKAEALSVADGTHVYLGETLHDGAGDPDGSSGGSIYQVLNGTPTAFGVISARSASDATKGMFKELTAADVAQIQAWVAGADAGGPATTTPAGAVASSTGLGALSSGPLAAHSAPGLETGMADMLQADAGSFSGGTQAAMVDVAAAITQACRDGGTFDAMAQDAATYLRSTSANPSRDVSYLAGLLTGTTGAWSSTLQQTAESIISGSVFGAVTRKFAALGRQEGLGMGVANTSAVLDRDSATLAGVIADGHPSGVATPLVGPLDWAHPMAVAHGSHHAHHLHPTA